MEKFPIFLNMRESNLLTETRIYMFNKFFIYQRPFNIKNNCGRTIPIFPNCFFIQNKK